MQTPILYPIVSITIPCRNEEKYIGMCLHSIVACSYPKDKLSVYVCDGKSTDKTLSIIESLCQSHSFIHLLHNEKQTTPYALNMGLQADNADIKIILGAHAEIAPDYIEKCIEAFAISDEIGCVGGLLDNIAEDAQTDVIAKAMSSSFGVGNAHFRTGSYEGYVDTVAFGAYKNEVFEKIGFFDEDLVRNQDDEFNFRLLQDGYKIYLSRSIRAKYYVRASFSKLYRQYFQYGYWKVYVNKKHASITTVRQLIPFFFVAFLLFGWLLFLIPVQSIYILYPLGILLYMIAAFVFSTRISLKPSICFKIVFTFLILHFSYGLGYIKGVIDFFVLNSKPGYQKLSR